jgi:hypothetical protein
MCKNCPLPAIFHILNIAATFINLTEEKTKKTNKPMHVHQSSSTYNNSTNSQASAILHNYQPQHLPALFHISNIAAACKNLTEEKTKKTNKPNKQRHRLHPPQ